MKRYIIVGGCSYAHNDLNSVSNIVGNDVEFLNINTSASSNRYISESIISTCDLLLKNGIPSQNIFVLNNFTQIGRVNPVLPKELQLEVEKSIGRCEIRSFFQYPYYKFSINFVTVNERMYHLLIGYHGKSSSVKSWISEQEKYYFNIKNPISYFEDYLTDIVMMQNYLKQNKILFASYMMNNVFDGWKDNLSHSYTSFTKWELPSTKEYKHISELSNTTRILWEMIDLDKIVFYKTEKNKYGGIDEYFIDKFKDRKYLHDKSSHSNVFYGNHPNECVYGSFTNELLKPKLKKWIQKNLL